MRRKKPLTSTFVTLLDKLGMLRTLARLRGSALRGRALARAMFIAGMAIALSVASPEKIDTAEADSFKPLTVMDLKLYLANQLNDWDQFECANWLGIKESNWRVDAVNMRSGAYGIFQHMSDYAKQWDGITQINKHIEYINHRYDGSWCKALRHLETKGWH